MDARLGAGQPLGEAAALGRVFGSRQVGRMETVGCKDPGMSYVANCIVVQEKLTQKA